MATHRRPTALALAGCLLLAACLPSAPYREGRGIYSPAFSADQVKEAAMAGKVTDLGPFSLEVSACGNYTRGLADENLVEEPLLAKLPTLGANAADRIAAGERGDFFLLSLLIIPMGCSEVTLTGHALSVDLPEPGPIRR
jgi:hypothetical protein